MLTALAIAHYRSLRELYLPLGPLNVITGANGSGKSSVYRALRLLAECAQGGLIPALAREGGLDSALWAGPERITRAMEQGETPIQGTRRTEPVSLRLGFASEAMSYQIDLGLPIKGDSAFLRDPEIKGEYVWSGPVLRASSSLVERRGAAVRVREGRSWQTLDHGLQRFDSMLSQLADPRNAPELMQLREQVRGWRFYDHFRTDADAPARQPQIGTRTPVLDNEGRHLAAAMQTILEIGDRDALAGAVDDAFPGASIDIACRDGRFELFMHQHGLLRPLGAGELSDGTLRYLLWVAALLSPRPPELLVLNEPETSLHPDLLPALGRLIGAAAAHSQVVVVSHAARLISALERHEDCQSFMLEKSLGQTQVAGQHPLERPAWHWAER